MIIRQPNPHMKPMCFQEATRKKFIHTDDTLSIFLVSSDSLSHSSSCVLLKP